MKENVVVYILVTCYSRCFLWHSIVIFFFKGGGIQLVCFLIFELDSYEASSIRALQMYIYIFLNISKINKIFSAFSTLKNCIISTISQFHKHCAVILITRVQRNNVPDVCMYIWLFVQRESVTNVCLRCRKNSFLEMVRIRRLSKYTQVRWKSII